MIWLLIGYMYLFIHRPFEIWPALGDLHVELVYMLVTGAIWVCMARKQWLANPLHKALLGFVVAVLASWLASQWGEEGWVVVYKYLTFLVFYVLLATVVLTEKDLRRVTAAFLVIMTIYLLHSLWEFHNGRHEFRMGIRRLIGVDTTLGNPNAFGSSILYALVFVPALWHALPSKGWRVFLAGYLALSVGCIGLTGSRGSFVGLLLWVGMTVAGSRKRWVWGLGALLAAPVLWAALPESLQTRFETIIHPDVGPANAQLSAQGRIEGLYLGLDLWRTYPATGCGVGAWKPATGRTLESHNLYGQVLGETGTFGALTFAALLLLYWWNVSRIARAYRRHPEWDRDFLYHLGRGLGVALVLLLFEGNFNHCLFRFTWVWYSAFLVIARHCVERRLSEATLPAWEADTGWYEPAVGVGQPEWGVGTV